MKINTKVRYGLRALIEIQNNQNEGILQKQIAEAQDIPLAYLDSIISGLRNAGLIANYSGKSSGYKLTRQASEISVYDVYRAFEPELTLVNCVCPTNDCKRNDICPTKDYWFELNKQIKQLMKNTTLEELTVNEENNLLITN
jgi:Rrf2 family protein